MTNNIFQFISLNKILIVFVLVFLSTTGLDLFAIERLQGVSFPAAGLSSSWLAASRAIGDAATHDASEVKHGSIITLRADRQSPRQHVSAPEMVLTRCHQTCANPP